MLDIGWPELMLVAVVTLLVVGPKELPRVLRTVTQWVRKAREVAREFQSGLDDMAREADLDDLKKTMQEAATDSLGTDLDDVIDPTRSIGGEFDEDPFAEPTAPTPTPDATSEPADAAPPAADAPESPAPEEAKA
jgi:sec-independent protein translocase protein TatB